ncbi:MAG: hypothetical protein R3C20_10230 [Planctomycetaceae bacterium]
MFRNADSPEPRFSSKLAPDMGDVVPSLAGPKRPQDRILLKDMLSSWTKDRSAPSGKTAAAPVKVGGSMGESLDAPPGHRGDHQRQQ